MYYTPGLVKAFSLNQDPTHCIEFCAYFFQISVRNYNKHMLLLLLTELSLSFLSNLFVNIFRSLWFNPFVSNRSLEFCKILSAVLFHNIHFFKILIYLYLFYTFLSVFKIFWCSRVFLRFYRHPNETVPCISIHVQTTSYLIYN